jgi:hypothetical protein
MSYEHPTHDELVRETLLRMMEDISEDCWCAGWLQDLEYTLWRAVITGNLDFGWGMQERELTRLKHLHEMAGGWWIWADEEKGRRFVSTEEWLKIYAEKSIKAPEINNS